MKLTIWDNIEQKLTSNPTISRFAICDILRRTDFPLTWYDLNLTVWSIYKEAEYNLKHNKLSGIFKKNTYQDRFIINQFVSTDTEELLDGFIKVTNEISISPEIMELLKLRKSEESHLNTNILKFKAELQKMIDKYNDTEELKGVCSECRSDVEESKGLNIA